MRAAPADREATVKTFPKAGGHHLADPTHPHLLPDPVGFQNSAAGPDLVFLCGSLVLIDEAAEDGPALYPAPAPAHRPHLTLASAERFLPAAAAAIAGALHVLPIQVRLDGVRFFGDRAGVLAWAVDDDGALRELQAQALLALDGAGRRPQHEPGLWTPHVSLAQRLRPG